jgi:tRNA threonylcarbamoyladenosine modification (KEOPS) complex  Pcc1 subunit
MTCGEKQDLDADKQRAILAEHRARSAAKSQVGMTPNNKPLLLNAFEQEAQKVD